MTAHAIKSAVGFRLRGTSFGPRRRWLHFRGPLWGAWPDLFTPRPLHVAEPCPGRSSGRSSGHGRCKDGRLKMSPFQRRLTRLGLKVLSRRGFALAGGYALQEHGFGDRWSDDVDLFTPFHGGPADAAPVLVQAYEAYGLAVVVEIIG